MCVRNDFLLFELHSEKNTFSPECGSNFENCSFRLVPFTFRLSVTGPLGRLLQVWKLVTSVALTCLLLVFCRNNETTHNK